MQQIGAIQPLVSCLTLLAGWLACSGQVQPAEEVRVSLVVILATDRDNKIDEKLRDIAKEIRKKNPKLTGFRLKTTTCKLLKLGAEDKFRLVDDQAAALRVERSTEKRNRFCVMIKAPTLVGEIAYTAACSKYFLIVTSYATKKDDDRLIIGIMVQSRPGGE